MTSSHNTLSTLTNEEKVNTGIKNNTTEAQKDLIHKKLLDAVYKNDLI